jgi:integrase
MFGEREPLSTLRQSSLLTPMKVTIENHDGRLRLNWQYNGKRYTMSCGVPNNPTGKAIAKQKAAQVEQDLLTGNFDPTLVKYRPQTLGKNATEVSAPDLFSKFTFYKFKEHDLAPRSRNRYECIQKYLERHLNVKAHSVGDRASEDFAALLTQRLAPSTAKERLGLLSACWVWAQGKYKVASDNPWTAHRDKVKLRKPKAVKPFNKTEVAAILKGFQQHQHYSHYYPFVVALFNTGARFGEIAGLRWKNVADDFQSLYICESFTRGHRRDRTKTGKDRTVNLGPSLAQLLKERHASSQPQPDDLVFPSPKGKAIDDHNFLNRAWKTVLASSGVEYRKTYAVRHSAISHALANGANPIALAEQTGHDKRVLLSTYAHAIESKSLFVEF